MYRWWQVRRGGGGGGGAERIRRKFFIQYLRRLILGQIEFYYPTAGTAAVEKQFFLLFHNSQVMYPSAVASAPVVRRANGSGGVPFDGLKI